MKTRTIALLAILAGAAAISCVVMRAGSPKPKGERFLEVRFASIGAGINTKALDVVLDTVCEGARRGRVERVLSRSWGLEGERDFCIQYTSAEALRQDLARIRARLPRGGSSQPLPTLRTADECATSTADPPFAEIDPCASR
jgi:hypothetical protein